MLSCIVCREMIECQAGQEGRVVDNWAYAPFLLQIDIIFVDHGLFGAVQNGEYVWI